MASNLGGHGPMRLSETEMFARLYQEAAERESEAYNTRPVDQLHLEFTNASGLTRLEAIETHRCISCTTDGPVDFKDLESVREYHLTGMCQGCQDDFYNESKGY